MPPQALPSSEPIKKYTHEDFKAISELALQTLKNEIAILFDDTRQPSDIYAELGLSISIGSGDKAVPLIESKESARLRDFDWAAGFSCPKKRYRLQGRLDGAVAPGLIWAYINGSKPYLSLKEVEKIFGDCTDLSYIIQVAEKPPRRTEDYEAPFIEAFFQKEKNKLEYQGEIVSPKFIEQALLYTLAAEGKIRDASPVYIPNEEIITTARAGTKSITLKSEQPKSLAKEYLDRICKFTEGYLNNPASINVNPYGDKVFEVGAALQFGLLQALNTGHRKSLTDREYDIASDVFGLVAALAEKDGSFRDTDFVRFVKATHAVLIAEGMQLDSPDLSGLNLGRARE